MTTAALGLTRSRCGQPTLGAGVPGSDISLSQCECGGARLGGEVVRATSLLLSGRPGKPALVQELENREPADYPTGA